MSWPFNKCAELLLHILPIVSRLLSDGYNAGMREPTGELIIHPNLSGIVWILKTSQVFSGYIMMAHLTLPA
jgi:hypothetical protein